MTVLYSRLENGGLEMLNDMFIDLKTDRSLKCYSINIILLLAFQPMRVIFGSPSLPEHVSAKTISLPKVSRFGVSSTDFLHFMSTFIEFLLCSKCYDELTGC